MVSQPMSPSDQQPVHAVTFRRRTPPSLADMLRHRPTPTRSPFSIPKATDRRCTETGNNTISDITCSICSMVPFSSNDNGMPLDTVGCVRCANNLHEMGVSSVLNDPQQGNGLIGDSRGVNSMEMCASSTEVHHKGIADAKQCDGLLLQLACCAVTDGDSGTRSLSFSSNAGSAEDVGCMIDTKYVQRQRRKALVPRLPQQ